MKVKGLVWNIFVTFVFVVSSRSLSVLRGASRMDVFTAEEVVKGKWRIRCFRLMAGCPLFFFGRIAR